MAIRFRGVGRANNANNVGNANNAYGLAFKCIQIIINIFNLIIDHVIITVS